MFGSAPQGHFLRGASQGVSRLIALLLSASEYLPPTKIIVI
ncbi:MAG: hypothetical protein U9N60_02095 [Thermodesulfobacteriota bacterium]|nr:hypothetical protein [Thermodesulfobacteriota bacterium]